MALRALMKRKELNDAKKRLDEIIEEAKTLEQREADLEKSIEEAETEEERAAVNAEIEAFEADREANETAQQELEDKIRGIEQELEEIEQAAPEPQGPQPEARNERSMIIMNKRNIFEKMSIETRTALFAREDVTDFLGEIRAAIKEKRAITGGNLLVPEVFLGLIRQNIEEYSKLYKHVNVRQLSGDGTMVVMGTIPEAVWTQCCANLNEMELVFNDAEVGCWKVGGFFDICNATLEDSAIDLASEVVTVLGQAVGRALDKAIVFGLGNRMPLGFFTRLEQTSEPGSYPSTARAWVDLHTSNIKTIANTYTGAALIAEIVKAAGNAKGKYSRGEKVWIMNETTYTFLAAATVNVTAEGSIVTGVLDRMPVVGGIIEVLDFMPDYVIAGGFLDLYLLGERKGVQIAQSEHVKFIEDRTVFKGIARYDGLPVIAEGFVAIGINGTTPASTGITFQPDTANTVQGVILNKTTASVGTGQTVQLYANTIPGGGAVTWTSGTEAKATVDQTGKVTGVATGTSVITATSGTASASCTVTVTT